MGIGLCHEGVALARISRETSQPVFHHIDYRPAKSINELGQAVSDWVRQNNLRDCPANFVLTPEQADTMLTEAPEVTDAELVKAMRWKVKEMIDYDVNEAVVDCFAIPGQRERGRQPMAYVVTAAMDVLKAYASTIQEAQLNLCSIDIPAMAQRNVASLLPEDSAGVALLSLYQRGGLLSLTREGGLYLSRELETGYSSFAQPVDETQNDSGGLSIEGMPPATQSTLDQLVLEVQRSTDYYERYFAHPPINSLVIAPTPFPIPGMIDYMAGQLGMQVRELDMNVLLGLDDKMERDMQTQCLPAIGAALRWPIAA